jgi:uroporphyrinogen-III synthase
METESVAWDMPATLPAAIMLTSRSAARLANAPAFHALPAFVIGTATASAAAAAGFTNTRSGGSTVQALLDAVAIAGFPSVLHLVGEDHTPVVIPARLHVETRIVYRARLLPLIALPAVDWVLLYSPRSASYFAKEVDRLGHSRGSIAIAAISEAALATAGTGWRQAIAAHRPDEDALLAAVGIPCQ